MRATAETHPDLVILVDGEECLTPKAVALMTGVSVEEAQTVMREVGSGTPRPPKHWLRQGKEIAARLGVSDGMVALAILAEEAERKKGPLGI